MSTEAEIAWAAGLFEGEGCINYGTSMRRGREITRRRLNLEMKDEDVVRRFADVVGAGHIRPSKRRNRINRENHHDIYIWECGRWADAARILHQFLPYLGERRSAKAREMLADPAGPIGRRPKVAYRCSLCHETVAAINCKRHADWHRVRPDWRGAIGFLLVTA